MTLTELRLIAALAHMGETSPTAAKGTHIALYMNARNRFWRIEAEVARLSRLARTIARRSPFTNWGFAIC